LNVPAINLPHNWEPREYQKPAWNAWLSGINRQLLIWHRRAGKDDIQLRQHSVGAFNRVGPYWHMLPEYAQARKAIWDAVNPHTGKRRIDEAFPHEIRADVRNNDMFIRFKNESTFQVVGSDSYDSLVGTSPIGVTASEWGLANPTAWAYLSPILAENNGWAAFISTPRGNNHLKSMYDRHKTNPKWFVERLTVDDTHAITPEAIEEQRGEYEALYGEAVADVLIQQEFYCSFAGGMIGAYYADLVDTAEREGRIKTFDIDRKHPVHTAWDLGKGGRNPIWCFQVIDKKLYIVDFLRPDTDDLEDWCKWLADRGYHGNDYVPHDIMTPEWGTNRTRFEKMQALSRKPVRVPMLPIEDGRNAARMTLKVATFHKENTELAVDGLRSYRREWDDEMKRFRESPVKDWADHIADGFRYLSLAWKSAPQVDETPPKPKELVYTVTPRGVIMGNMTIKEAIEARKRKRAGEE
jgi:phage terminase large subunit